MQAEQQEKILAVSIVIPTWNGRGLLKRFLPSVVEALTAWPGGGEIVVADDGGSDGTVEFLAAQFPAVRAVRSELNRGFAEAANMGMAAARNRVVVLLNNDVEAERQFIAPLVRWFEDSTTFAVCARSLDWDHSTFRDGGKAGYWKRGFWRVWRNYEVARGPQAKPEQWPSIYGSGGFTAFDRDKWLLLGGLDELFAPFNWEDTDICYRALKRGWHVLYEPESVVYHSPNTTIGSTSRRLRVRFISRRNRLLFHWKNLTDTGMLIGNILHSCFSLPLALLRLDLAAAGAFFAAAWRLNAVRARRKVEKREAVVSDSAIRDQFIILETRIKDCRDGRLE
jgi:GT2 family glycosyltransferase